ncbi:MAG: glycosyltransferase family 4 protein [Flavobacteriales bacterium]
MTNSVKSPVKVLRIINRFNLGGPIYNVTYLTKFLPESYETELIGGCATTSEHDATFILETYGVAFKKIDSMSRSIRLFGDIRTFLTIRKLIKTYKPTIVHTHASKAGALGRLAAKTMGVPVIIHTYHGHVFQGYFDPFVSRLIILFERFLGTLSTKIITISPEQQQEIVHKFNIVPLEKSCIIPLGFDLKRFEESHPKRNALRSDAKIGDKQCAVTIVGRLTPIKNHRLFIDAAALVLHEYPNEFKFFIVGDGELKTTLKAYIETTHPTCVQNIVFTSWIQDMTTLYPAMDLVCLTSINEGTPVSLIEAQASGIPVISTNVGGVKDIIKANETGIIMEGYSKEELASHLIQLHLNPSLRAKMSQNARNFVKETFTYQRLVEDMDRLYKNLLSNE